MRFDKAIYHLASPLSQIKVYDHRPHVARAAQLALNGKDEDAFADVFCQSARIQLEAKDDLIQVDIFEDQSAEPDGLTLWMGVIDDNRMAVADTEWEFLKGIEEPKIAFAALIH